MSKFLDRISDTLNSLGSNDEKIAEIKKHISDWRTMQQLGRISIDAAIDLSADYFKLSKEHLIRYDRHKYVLIPRMMIMYYLKAAGHTFMAIGEVFGRDHSSVIHSVNVIRDLVGISPEDCKTYAGLELLLDAQRTPSEKITVQKRIYNSKKKNIIATRNAPKEISIKKEPITRPEPIYSNKQFNQ